MKQFLLAALAILTIGSARAQSQQIEWKTSATSTGKGTYNLIFHAVLTRGWLLWSLHPGVDKSLVAPSFKVDPATATVTGETSEQGFTSDLQFPGIEGYTRSYNTEAMFIVPINGTKGKTVKGSYTYQLRNKDASLSPMTVPFAVKLP